MSRNKEAERNKGGLETTVKAIPNLTKEVGSWSFKTLGI